jgi:hypothetical protein
MPPRFSYSAFTLAPYCHALMIAIIIFAADDFDIFADDDAVPRHAADFDIA